MPVNTATLKTFAPAMRRQLIEAVGRKLDRLLTSQTPDTLTTYARQIADLRQQEQASRQACWSGWPTAGPFVCPARVRTELKACLGELYGQGELS